jgi:acetylornithine deacetylase/succinyl-diaminopimelate desuccinylase-like protein
MAHLDVVDARTEDWSFDPFVLREEGGWFYGRGTRDNKAGAANIVANMIRWKREGWLPERDVIAVLTTDEETDAAAGIRWLLENRRDLVDAAYCLNSDGGDGELRDGKRYILEVQAAEKIYGDFRLEVRNRGGHSSLPRPDNAIYVLAAALRRLAEYQFPVKITEVTRAYLERAARLETGERRRDLLDVVARGGAAEDAVRRLSADPTLNALLRTTCVATQLEGGHAPNALPQLAAATVNCRAIPGTALADLKLALEKVVSDSQVRVVPLGEWTAGPASPLFPRLLSTIERLAAEFFPGAAVIPSMATGATDGLYLRNAGIPTYGVSALFDDPSDVRAHGRDERISVAGYYASVQFWYRLVKDLASLREP